MATYQSLSGAGFPGIPSLSITDNVIPYIVEEEEKLAGESPEAYPAIRAARINPLRVPVLAHCARIATREGHLEAVTIEATRRPRASAIETALRSFDPLAGRKLPSAPHPPILLRPELDRPQPLRDRWAGSPPSARGMAVSVGRVRWEPPYFRFALLSHNAVRGGAGGSLLNAEFTEAEGWLDE